MDEGHLYRLRPCGTHKQILHSINLHLFAHPCCQRLLPREAAKVQQRQSRLRSRLGLPYWLGVLQHRSQSNWISKLGMLFVSPVEMSKNQ